MTGERYDNSMEVKDILYGLTSAYGVSGDENCASALAKKYLEKYTSNVEVDSFNNVIAYIGQHDEGKKTLLLDAHIDEIGMIVTYIDDEGFLKISNCGGVDRRILLASQVIVHSSITGEQLVGIITSKPPHLKKGDEGKKAPEIDDISIDVGLSAEQARESIALGDRVTIHSQTRQMLNDRVCSKAMDDRAGVTAILWAIELLSREYGASLDEVILPFNVAVLFSSLEEVNIGGAKIASYKIDADEALVVDVSFAHTFDAPAHKCGKMGDGAMIGIAPTLDRAISDRLIKLGKEKNIPYQIEVMAGKTSTNADAISISRDGVRTCTISIPLRYMHTPIETLQISDIQSVSTLIFEYIKRGCDNC